MGIRIETILPGGFVARFTYPVLFTAATLAYWLPGTATNVGWTLVDPVVSPKDRREYAQAIQDSWQRAQALPGEWQKHAMEGVGGAVEQVEQAVLKVFK